QALSVTMQFGTAFEYIRHACAKHTLSATSDARVFIPRQRFIPVRVGKETPIGGTAPHLMTHPLRPKLRVTIVAGRRNLGTPPPRIKSVIRPLYRGILGHCE